jgi:uncharacterized membrane protein YphA (DoxX/SURF4 family)
MPLETPPSKAMFWTGWVLSAIPGLFLLSGAFTALSGAKMVVEGMAPFGFNPVILPYLGITELLCSVLYLIPRTAPIGAILMTAYMGGAVVTHARIGDPMWVVPVVFAVIVWIGLLLRRPALRQTMLGW